MSLSVVILAAGQGSRMQSALPKVLHPIGGKPILYRILSTISQLNPKQIIVVHGNQGETLKNALTDFPAIRWVKQERPLGTGDAALSALSSLEEEEVDNVLILYSDIPLIRMETLSALLKIPKGAVGLITEEVADPTGLGRILRDKEGKILRIVEEKDATDFEKKIKEINTGFFLVPKPYLQKWLKKLTPNNLQQEYYLTDMVAQAHEEQVPITTISPKFTWEILGVNDKIQLANLERIYQQQQALSLMQQGVTLLDPMRLDVRGEVKCGQDVMIDINVVLEGQVTLGSNVKIGPNVYIKNAIIEDNVEILASSIIENAIIGAECNIGPFARIRPETVLAEKVKIGNFVEVKNVRIGKNSKVNHLSYIGDATIGQEVNIGAGTITCNFDGRKKHKTVIEDRVFIGSDTQLIAPVTIGEGVTIGAGTTVTRDVPSYYLLHNRIEQRSVSNWKKLEEEQD